MGYHKALAGLGALTLIPSGANPTPIDLAVVSGFKHDHEEEDIDLDQGDGLDILDSFPAGRKVTGTLEVADLSAKLVSAVTGGVTTAAGQKVGATHRATIPATPFQITVPQSANWDTDLVVVDLTAGKQLTRVAAAPATGQYAANAGVYTFAAADTGHVIFIRYRYTLAASGIEAKVAAVLSGQAPPKLQLHAYAPTASGKLWGFYYPLVRVPGLSVALERKSWSKVSLKWKALLSATDELYYVWTPE